MDNYDLELEKVFVLVERNSAKKVCLQFPDGLKPKADFVYNSLSKKFPDCSFYIWGDTAFGSCDLPLILEKYGFDLVIQFGHSKWK